MTDSLTLHKIGNFNGLTPIIFTGRFSPAAANCYTDATCKRTIQFLPGLFFFTS